MSDKFKAGKCIYCGHDEDWQCDCEPLDLDHPCRETCSGWRQGYMKGERDSDAYVAALLAEAEFLREALEKIQHAVANAWEWQVSEAEDSELDRDQQIGNWCEKACDEIKSASARFDKFKEGMK